MKRVGVEKINLYGCSLFLDQRQLAEARGLDPEKVVSDYLISTRSLNPLYEDTVTMAVNAARPMLTSEDIDEIGLLIVGTEGSLDYGKPISTNIHGALGLPSNVRNYEVKHACYCGVAALDTAINWVASDLNRGKKALVISTDFSRMHLHTKEEFVMGGSGAAVLIGDNPKIIEYEAKKHGTWTTNVYDTFRPSARHEVGNNEVSLYSYLDALEGSYIDYLDANPDEVDFDNYFTYNIYHTPFAGMAFQAHRTLCNLVRRRNKTEIQEGFKQKVWPSLRFSRRVGSTYGASNFAGLSSLALSSSPLKPGDRIGFFAYGSGAIGEFYSATLCEEARETVKRMNIDEQLDSRRETSVEDYEKIEKLRENYIDNPTFQPDISFPEGWYKTHYEGKGLLVLQEVKDFVRTYRWS